MAEQREPFVMADGKAEIFIDASPDEIWNLIRDYGGLESYMPGIESCPLDGDVRTIGMMGIEIKEQLRSSDDATRTLSYSVIESPMDNLESHLATISIAPEGTGSHVTWAVEVEPDELLGLFQPVYEGALQALKPKLEG
jgi:carbon monoxide dehydrogenase subunit G